MPLRLPAYASSIASHRLLLYSILSSGAVLTVVANALNKHNNFYSIAVYLSRSNGAVVVLANFAVFLALLWGRFLQRLFFGPLRPMEVERLYDRMWFFVTESLLAFTIFRDEFDTPFALCFGVVLFTKCFHWLLSDRVEWMDQRPFPGPPLFFHIRTLALFSLLGLIDFVAFLLTIEYMITFGVGGTVLFASEYAILLASLLNSFAKYCITLADLRRAASRGGENAPPWEDKSMLIFYVELATDFLKLVTYLTFFMIVLAFYGLPLNIVRDVYVTARSFIMRFRDLIRYRTATRNMNERYPNATEAELNAMSDRTCIICRDEMASNATEPPADGTTQAERQGSRDGPNTTPKKLPCGHIFHFYCLRSWLERQQSCPTCRRSVLESDQPARAAGQIPPAQPGVVPPAGNQDAWNVPLQQRQMPNQPLGLFGRLMGAAGGPPAVQFQNGQMEVRPAMVNEVAGEGPRPQGQQGQPHAFHPLQPHNYAPPQRFQGFRAPDGVWYPWPYPRDQPAERRPEAPTDQSGDTSTAGTHSRIESSTTSASPNARNTAVQPASHQLNTSAPNQQAPSSLLPTPTTNASVVSEAAQSSIGARGPISARTAATKGARAPALIPLFDPNLQPRAPRTFRLRERADIDFRDLRNLPLELTEEQLSNLDHFTRDALDERLRILESVQATTDRCIEQLLRCRSALPREIPISSSTPTTEISSSEQPTRSTHSSRRNEDESGSSELQSRQDGDQPPDGVQVAL